MMVSRAARIKRVSAATFTMGSAFHGAAGRQAAGRGHDGGHQQRNRNERRRVRGGHADEQARSGLPDPQGAEQAEGETSQAEPISCVRVATEYWMSPASRTPG
jgi:hypothetical protein